MTTRTELFRLNGTVERDPAIDGWMKEHAGELGAIAQKWFEVMRQCGDEVRELLHDGCPTACLGDAAFGYVNVHVARKRRILSRRIAAGSGVRRDARPCRKSNWKLCSSGSIRRASLC
jgi:hypothetical protein